MHSIILPKEIVVEVVNTLGALPNNSRTGVIFEKFLQAIIEAEQKATEPVAEVAPVAEPKAVSPKKSAVKLDVKVRKPRSPSAAPIINEFIQNNPQARMRDAEEFLINRGLSPASARNAVAKVKERFLG